MMMVLYDTLTYWRVLWLYLRGSDYRGAAPFEGYDESLRMGVYVFSLALAIKLWDKPHYRKASYALDVRDNFRNVAIPGTGIPLSVLAYNKAATVVFLFVGYPLICLCAAAAHSRRGGGEGGDKGKRRPSSSVAEAYREQLLAPRDWFSLWRINSRLAAWHSSATRNPMAGKASEEGGWHEYAMENKWAFLEKGLKLGVPVSPVLDTSRLCIKHKNEEGGLGIHFFRNALNGGDWIIQEVMDNDDQIAALLPERAPLSTFRVMTASNMHRTTKKSTKDDVFPLSCVFRAGRAGAATDHSSILFDVDVTTGTIGRGTTNAQWYQLGKTLGVPWGPPPPVFDHPDTGKRVSGHVIADFKKHVLDVAVEAHKTLLPRVPLAGWDVVLSKNHGPCLLEVNLSCNFFRGSFDEPAYYDFVDKFFAFCQQREHQTNNHKLA